jgi:hypothetical protein
MPRSRVKTTGRVPDETNHRHHTMTNHALVGYLCLFIATTSIVATRPNEIPIAETRREPALCQLQVGEIADLLGTTVPDTICPSAPICSLGVTEFKELSMVICDSVPQYPVSATTCKWELTLDSTTSTQRFIALYVYCDTGQGFKKTETELFIKRSGDQFLVNIEYETKQSPKTTTATAFQSQDRNVRGEGGLWLVFMDGTTRRSTHLSLRGDGMSSPIVFQLDSTLFPPLSIEFPPVPDHSANQDCDVPTGYTCGRYRNELSHDADSTVEYTGYASEENLDFVITDEQGKCAWEPQQDETHATTHRVITMILYCEMETGITATDTILRLSRTQSGKTTLSIESHNLDADGNPFRNLYDYIIHEPPRGEGIRFKTVDGDISNTYGRLRADENGIDIQLVSDDFWNVGAHFPAVFFSESGSCEAPTGYYCDSRAVKLDQSSVTRTFYLQ